METFHEFAAEARREAIKVVGPNSMTNHALMMAMLQLLHARVVAMEAAQDHARPDADRREE